MKGLLKKKLDLRGPRLITFLVVLLILDLLLFVFLNRKPICIESQLLHQVEWIAKDGSVASAFNCEANIKVAMSRVFIEKHSEIQRRIYQFDSQLKANFLPIKPVVLSIREDATSLVQSTADHLIISEDVFFDRALDLERAYLRSWIAQLQKGQGLGLLRLEMLTQFLMWNLGGADPELRSWQQLLGQWPLFATSWSGYCKSPIKDKYFTALCLSPTFSKKAEALTPFSLNFWLAQKLWHSFQVLAVKDQVAFFKNLRPLIESLCEQPSQTLNEMSLDEMASFSRQEAEVWRKAFAENGFRDWGWNFASKVESDLTAYQGSLGRFDLLIKTEREWTSEELKILQEISLEDLNYRILGESDAGLWSFPWLTPLKDEAFSTIEAQILVLVVCEWPSVKKLMELKQKSNKVIVVQSCEGMTEPLIFSGLLHRGLQFFSLDNKDIPFVSVNLEALQFLVGREPLLAEKTLVARLQAADTKKYLANKAGWTSALWNEKYRAYEVHANLDVIEWFKLPENVWPDFE